MWGQETEQVAGNRSLGGTLDIFSAGRDRITPSLFSRGTNCLELSSPKGSPENKSPDQIIQCLHKKLCVRGMGLKGRN